MFPCVVYCIPHIHAGIRLKDIDFCGLYQKKCFQIKSNLMPPPKSLNEFLWQFQKNHYNLDFGLNNLTVCCRWRFAHAFNVFSWDRNVCIESFRWPFCLTTKQQTTMTCNIDHRCNFLLIAEMQNSTHSWKPWSVKMNLEESLLTRNNLLRYIGRFIHEEQSFK